MQVEIWSDVVCPWCAIGKARFEQALAGFPHREDVEVRWRSFELDAAAPPTTDGAYVERLAAKYGTSTAEAQSMIDRMTAQASGEGLTFRFDRARPGNTFDAHRLLHLAADRGVQHQLKDRLLSGYLSEGAAIGESPTLQRLAAEAGLDHGEVADVLAGEAYAEAVRADEEQATAFGIRGVPFFVFDRRLGVSGAQPAEVLGHALGEAWSTALRLTTVNDHSGHNAATCADGSCAV